MMKLTIEHVIALLQEHLSVTLPVQGISMLPFIVGGRDSLILQPLSDATPLRIGHIVLAHVDGPGYVIHRIISIDGPHLTLMGDGNLKGREHCSLSDVKALATHVVRPDGLPRPLYSTKQRLSSLLWRKLLPVRRYLLTIYKSL